jgi:excisionase family DNA binding protein
MSKLLNIAQLCAYLNISRRTYYRLRRQGRIPPPSVRFGAQRWRIELIDALIAEEEKRNAAANY